MSKTRLVASLVVFECNASVLANALNVGTENVLLMPHNNYLMITNIGETIYTCFNVMTEECFTKYDMSLEIKDEWLKKQLVTDLKPVIIPREDIMKLLNKISGNVEITIEDPQNGEIRYVIVKDLIDGNESSHGRFKIKEQIIDKERLLSRYIEFFDNEGMMIPKTAIMIGENCHILKIKDKLKFNPLIMKEADYKQFILSVKSITNDEFEIKVYNRSLEAEYDFKFKYDFIQSSDEARLQKYDSHEKTIYNFPVNPSTMELVLKYQAGEPVYLTIIEVDDPVAPFFIFFSSLKDMGDLGKVYTSSLLFLEGGEDINDIKSTREKE